MSDEVIDDANILKEITALTKELAESQDVESAYSLAASRLRRLTDADYAGVLVYSSGSSYLKFIGLDGLDSNSLAKLPQVLVTPEVRERLAKGPEGTATLIDREEDVPAGALELYKALDLGCMVTGSVFVSGELVGYLIVARTKEKQRFTEPETKIVSLLSSSLSAIMGHMRTTHRHARTKEATDGVMSVAPIGLMTVDSKGIILSVNKYMLTILSSESEQELVGTSVFEISAVVKSGLDALFMNAFDGHAGEKNEVHFVPVPDKVSYLHVKVVPVASEIGDVESVLLVAMDVTSNIRLQSQLERSYEKLIQTYQELERVTKMKTQFIDVVSHELRTPLTVMRGYLDLVESEYAPTAEPKFSQMLKTIRANADKLYALVESMLDVSRLEKGTLQINVEPTKIDTVLEEVVKARSHDAVEKKQSMSLEVEGELPLINADRRRIRDVFNNILDNSIKYTEEDGRVQIGARDEGKMIHVWIRDNGVGIPLENLGKIFDRFYIVASDDLSHQVNRIGLSLPISKGIVEAHGGRLWVESQVGKGSVFHISLPKEPSR
ncbi:MAG: ATP-binding protein [Thermoplasmata archaeon]|nr:ATP-binding protein [Thermoplasmata archaeon]